MVAHPFASVILAALASTVSCTATLVAQRLPVRGAAEHAEGGPWAGATVTLLARPVPTDERFGAEDRVRVAVGDDGRFWAELIPGRRYSVWAVEVVEAGRYRVSDVIEGYTAGNRLTLVASGPPRAPARIRVEGLDAWRGKGQIEVQALSVSENLDVRQLVLDDDGSAELPALPGMSAGIEVLLDGAPLLPWPDAVDLGSSDVEVVKVRAPRPTRLRILDPQGQPAPGVTFFLGAIDTKTHRRDAYRPLATSDANGELVVDLPIGTERKFAWVNYPAALRGPGWAPLQWIDRFNVPADHDGHTDEPACTLMIDRGSAWVGTVRSAGEPIANLPLRVHTQCGVADEKATPSSTEVYWGTQTDAQGRARADTDSERVVSVQAFPDAETLARYADKGPTKGFPLHPTIVLVADPTQAGRGAAKREVELDVDLADLAVLDVQVLDPSGSPASKARLAVGFASDQLRPRGLLRDVGTDHVGRVRMLLPRHAGLELVAHSAAGSIALPLDTTAARDQPLRVTLVEVASVPGVVLSVQGAPVPGARIRTYVQAEGGSATLAWGLNPLLLHADDDGRFAVPLYPGTEYRLTEVVANGDAQSVDVPRFKAHAPPDVLEVTLKR